MIDNGLGPTDHASFVHIARAVSPGQDYRTGLPIFSDSSDQHAAWVFKRVASPAPLLDADRTGPF